MKHGRMASARSASL